MKSSMKRRQVKPNRLKRRAAAVIELAVCLPILVLVGVATIDACSMFHVQQTLKITAYEGSRVGIVPDAQAANVKYQCQTLLDDHGVKGSTITMTPSDPSSLSKGDYFTVQISANFGQNALVGILYTDKILTRSVTLRAE